MDWSTVSPTLAMALAAQSGNLPNAYNLYQQQQQPVPVDIPGGDQVSQLKDTPDISSWGNEANSAINDMEDRQEQRRTHGRAMGEGLMSLGAGLLSGRNWSEGLSRGISAYQQTMNQFRPSTELAGNGEYQVTKDPMTGKMSWSGTPLLAQKLNEERKPFMQDGRAYQYDVDGSGNYTGIKDISPQRLQVKFIKNAAGADIPVLYDPTNPTTFYDPKSLAPVASAGGSAPAAGGAAPTGGSAPAPGPGGGFQPAADFILNHEGKPGASYRASDWNGYPTNWGINAKPNAGVLKSMGIADLRLMSRDQASQIYKSQYWDKSGAANLPAAMQIPYFDTYVRNPTKAQAFLAQSGGDPTKFMALREAWDTAAGRSHPGDAKGLMNRDRDLEATLANTAAPAAPSFGPDQDSSATPDNSPVPQNQPATDGNPWGLAVHQFGGGPPAQTPFTDAVRKQYGLNANAAGYVDAKGIPHVLDKGADPSATLSPDDAAFNGGELLAGVPMSQVVSGMGKEASAQRAASRHAMMQQANALGLGPQDAAIQIAHYKAASASVANLEKQFGTIQGNERTATLNGQAWLKASALIPAQTRASIFNVPINAALKATGDPHIAAANMALRTYALEYAKVVQGTPNGGGQITDSAANEAVRVMVGDGSLRQKQAAFQQAQIDMNNRMSALKGNLQNAYQHMGDLAPELQGRQRQPAAPSAAPRAAPKPGTVVRGYTFHGGNPADQRNWTKN